MISILNLTKLEERQFYDSWWNVETNQGNVKLHQYDGIKEGKLRKEIEKCNNLEEIKELEPKSFYFD
jgi:hypothetical protein